jgi:acetyl-CoA C-acetyltransferase
MTEHANLPDNTPILVAAGQVVQHEATTDSPMTLAARAAAEALASAGGQGLVEAIDTISITRLFTDSMGMPPCPFGRSDNPPMSVARALGAAPAHCIYGQVGGNEPQGRLIEFARDIAMGERSVVLLAGAEAMRNQRSAQRAGQELDWNESFDKDAFPLEDRGWGELFVTMQEVSNGLLAAMSYYGLIEQAQATAKGRSTAEHREAMAQLLAPLSQVAAANPQAQFPTALSAQEILSAAPLNHLYSKRMVAQDGVNQGAALLLCSVGAARKLGIPTERWVFLHGMAQGEELKLSEREDPARSPMLEAVLNSALQQAGKTADEMDLIDIYSCFPCAVSAVADCLGLPLDGSRPLTLTGGLAYFGGPGNNYVMHSLAEAVSQLQTRPGGHALVTSVGGMLSKLGAGVFSTEPSSTDWAAAETRVGQDFLSPRPVVEAPEGGRVISYLVNYRGGEPVQANVLAETEDGGRFVATTAPGDAQTPAAMLATDPTGGSVTVTVAEGGGLHFGLG